jgi:hypothetical protein
VAISVVAQVRDLTAEEDAALVEALDPEASPPARGRIRMAEPAGGRRRIAGLWDSDKDYERFRDDRLMPALQGRVELACGPPGQSFKLSLGEGIAGRRRGKRHGLVVAGEVHVLLAADIQAQQLRAGGDRDVRARRMAPVG